MPQIPRVFLPVYLATCLFLIAEPIMAQSSPRSSRASEETPPPVKSKETVDSRVREKLGASTAEAPIVVGSLLVPVNLELPFLGKDGTFDRRLPFKEDSQIPTRIPALLPDLLSETGEEDTSPITP